VSGLEEFREGQIRAPTELLELDRSRAATWTLGRVLQVAVWDLVRFNEGHICPSYRTIAEVLIDARA
jgi:hypothetical protein